MKAWNLAAIFVLWIAVVTADIPTLRYVVSNDGNTYIEFLSAVRKQIATGGKRYGIPVLPDPSTVPDSDRYIYLELQSSESGKEALITLAQDVTTSNLVAYKAKQESFFFDDAPSSAINILFSDTKKTKLPYVSDYVEIARIAETLREEVDLGPSKLANAVSDVYNNVTLKPRLKSFLVILEMIFGASRFRYLERIAHKAFVTKQSTRADLVIQVLEDSWNEVAEAIQKSNQGLFPATVRLWRSSFSSFRADSLMGPIISNMAFMPFVCPQRLTTFQINPIIFRRVAAEDTECLSCNTVPEPILPISGPNGLCVEVRNIIQVISPVELKQCASDADVYQLWTFKKDGTIQSKSNGWCLTINGNSSGADVVIQNCESANPKSIQWKLVDDGTMINPNYQLALTGLFTLQGLKVVADSPNPIPGQGWLATNNTEPFVTTIIGYSEYCLETNKDGAVWIAECETGYKTQQWTLFPDGTIRTEIDDDKKTCITCESKTNDVVTAPCENRVARQRFFFQNDTIGNLADSSRVMEVKNSDPSLRKIICAPYVGTTNQQWLAKF